jgi:hypothetical protein
MRLDKFSKIKDTKSLITFFTVRYKNRSIAYDILKLNKGSKAENFSPIGVTIGARR